MNKSPKRLLRHAPSPHGWRVLVMRRDTFRRKWIWENAWLIKHSDAYLAIWRYICKRGIVRMGLDYGVRLIAPDGTIAAEEFAKFHRVEGPGGTLIVRRIRWAPGRKTEDDS